MRSTARRTGGRSRAHSGDSVAPARPARLRPVPPRSQPCTSAPLVTHQHYGSWDRTGTGTSTGTGTGTGLWATPLADSLTDTHSADSAGRLPLARHRAAAQGDPCQALLVTERPHAPGDARLRPPRQRQAGRVPPLSAEPDAGAWPRSPAAPRSPLGTRCCVSLPPQCQAVGDTPLRLCGDLGPSSHRSGTLGPWPGFFTPAQRPSPAPREGAVGAGLSPRQRSQSTGMPGAQPCPWRTGNGALGGALVCRGR